MAPQALLPSLYVSDLKIKNSRHHKTGDVKNYKRFPFTVIEKLFWWTIAEISKGDTYLIEYILAQYFYNHVLYVLT
jgi:hypothetical protein